MVCFIAFLVGVLCLLPVSIRREWLTIILLIISTPFWTEGKPSSRAFAGRVHHWSHGGYIHGAGTNCFRLDLRAGITIQRLRVCAWIQTMLRVEICVAGLSDFVYGTYLRIPHKFALVKYFPNIWCNLLKHLEIWFQEWAFHNIFLWFPNL